ncbi:Hypothetical protein R9X50_00292300 [Acrodontium crateriforme]|uniref:SHSP domain-containing protein n=1 Tax=Acrodontium crateriforme TaxID=150365 RepID=A0AAQ3M294_9PEZI|nr:Hypothetical protein R9X50_00292300 [Acrodontium crateriforme]
MSYCFNNRSPQVYRIVKAAPTYTTSRNMAFFPRVFASEFAPVFRLLDDYATHVASSSTRAPAYNQCISNNFRTFQPRFDVKENKDSYELFGELPGIQQKDINIEFTDASTLSIKGRTESIREEGTRPSAAIGSQTEQAQLTSNAHADNAAAAENDAEWDNVTKADSDTSTTYHKATVQDEGAEANSTVAATPAETPGASEVAQTVTAQQPAPEGPKYWLSERSVGSFARTFSFPDRVDHDNVKASLQNGILSIVVPKAAVPVTRRINIE